jgi:hypothetical protein
MRPKARIEPAGFAIGFAPGKSIKIAAGADG